MEFSEQVGFYSDGSYVIVDNYSNSHICSEEYMFTDKIEPFISNRLSTIGRKVLIQKGIGAVS